MTEQGKALAGKYNRIAGAHSYIVGFCKGSSLYYVKLDWQGMLDLLKEDHASSSKGGYFKLRVLVSATQALQFLTAGKAVKVGTVDDLSADNKHNKGENFERIITEKLTGKTWEKDSIPFYVQGDINVNGEEIQIKLSSAELTNEKTIRNAMEKLGLAE